MKRKISSIDFFDFMRSQPYVDERLRAASDDAQKLRRPQRNKSSRFWAFLLPLLALVVLAAVPHFLIGQHQDAAELPHQGAPTRQRRTAAPKVQHDLSDTSPSPPAASSSTNTASSEDASLQPVLPWRRPPYSAASDCRRSYDRAGSGDGFARCGGSCCRSHAGIACYYLTDHGLCDRFLGNRGADVGAQTAASAAAAPIDTAGQLREAAEPSAGDGSDGSSSRTASAHIAATASSAAAAYAAASSTSSVAASLAAAFTPESLQALLPMVRVQPDTHRRPRLWTYPLFNLSWTRGASPPRSDGWAPTEGQRGRLPERDLKERYYQSCAVVGSSGTVRRSGYGRFIDAHEMIMRFNGAPAGGGYAADVGARTTLSVLADIASTECIAGKARQPTLDPYAHARMDGNLLQEPAPGWRQVSHCQFYPEAEPPPSILFLPKRDGVRRLLEYALSHATMPVYIRSDALGEEVDAQVGAFQDDTSHPTSGFNGLSLALHICETIDIYGFGSPRDKFYSPPKVEKAGTQHLYRTEMRWILGLEQRFPERVRIWP